MHRELKHTGNIDTMLLNVLYINIRYNMQKTPRRIQPTDKAISHVITDSSGRESTVQTKLVRDHCAKTESKDQYSTDTYTANIAKQ